MSSVAKPARSSALNAAGTSRSSSITSRSFVSRKMPVYAKKAYAPATMNGTPAQRSASIALTLTSSSPARESWPARSSKAGGASAARLACARRPG